MYLLSVLINEMRLKYMLSFVCWPLTNYYWYFCHSVECLCCLFFNFRRFLWCLIPWHCLSVTQNNNVVTQHIAWPKMYYTYTNIWYQTCRSLWHTDFYVCVLLVFEKNNITILHYSIYLLSTITNYK